MTENSENAFEQEIIALREEVAILNQHRFVRAHDSWFGLVIFNLLRGLAFGLGSVIGATVLVSLSVYLLAQVDFIPIIGDYAAQIIEIIQDSQ